MLRFATRMTAALLCASALAGCATSSTDIARATGGDTAAGHERKEAAAAMDRKTPTDLDGGVRQAQLLRSAGRYDDAIHILSQLMLVSADDPRVVSEYGKNLAAEGRAQDAVEFLGRAIELQSNDWTLYSAIGVSYDQLGNQNAARTAYDHALALRPEEPSVLNNYALSRMLAGDTAGARALIARAEAAGGGKDSKIAANIALLEKVAPKTEAAQTVASTEKPALTSSAAPVALRPATVAQDAPRSIVSSNLPPVAPQKPAPASGVVMQTVPVDPLAGPVTHAKTAATSKPGNTSQAAAKSAASAGAVKTADAKPAKAVLTPPAIVISDAKTPPAKTSDTKSASAKTGKDEVPALRLASDARAP